jgi:hypothetical protein
MGWKIPGGTGPACLESGDPKTDISNHFPILKIWTDYNTFITSIARFTVVMESKNWCLFLQISS